MGRLYYIFASILYTHLCYTAGKVTEFTYF